MHEQWWLVSGGSSSIEWACVLCGCRIQNDWASRAMNLHQILDEAWIFFHRNYLDDSQGHSSGQLGIGSFIMTTHPLMHHVSCSFLLKHQIIQVTQSSYSPDLVFCSFWLFLKLKSPLKGKRFQTIDEIQENTTGNLMVIGRTVWSPKVPTLKGTGGVIVLCTVFFVSSSIKVFIFHIMWLDTFWTDLIFSPHNNSVSFILLSPF